MPPRRRTPPPIPIDVEAVRRKLDEGKIVRVAISKSAQFPEGGTGRVRRVGDPTIDGEEFIQVELSLNGTRDVLPFTPADLSPATRATRAKAEPNPPQRSRPIGRSDAVGGSRSVAADRPAVPLSRPTGPDSGGRGVGAPTSGPGSAGPGSAAAEPGGSGDPLGSVMAGPPRAEVISAGTASAAPTGQPASSASPTGPPVARGKGNRGGKTGGKKSPAVTITIATTDSEPPQWKIEARVGVRVVLRSGTVSPARVWELVQQLDDETLTRTVGGVLDDQRRAAQARADALAAELAQVRAELEALPGGR